MKSSTRPACINPYYKTKKVFQRFLLRLIRWEVALTFSFFILNMEKTIRTSQYRFVYAILVEFFILHLLKEKSRFYNFLKPRYMQNKKSLSSIFITVGQSTIMLLLHFEYGKNDHNKSIGTDYTTFVEFLTPHLLKNKPRFYHLPMPRYMQNTQCCKTFGTPGIHLK